MPVPLGYSVKIPQWVNKHVATIIGQFVPRTHEVDFEILRRGAQDAI
ncbi:MAG: hypothetical protein JJE02_07095, partial [Propionibacteriales bacterium]|nr:hypothetical protein [Propionibacteriales bacterium]